MATSIAQITSPPSPRFLEPEAVDGPNPKVANSATTTLKLVAPPDEFATPPKTKNKPPALVLTQDALTEQSSKSAPHTPTSPAKSPDSPVIRRVRESFQLPVEDFFPPDTSSKKAGTEPVEEDTEAAPRKVVIRKKKKNRGKKKSELVEFPVASATLTKRKADRPEMLDSDVVAAMTKHFSQPRGAIQKQPVFSYSDALTSASGEKKKPGATRDKRTTGVAPTRIGGIYPLQRTSFSLLPGGFAQGGRNLGFRAGFRGAVLTQFNVENDEGIE